PPVRDALGARALHRRSGRSVRERLLRRARAGPGDLPLHGDPQAGDMSTGPAEFRAAYRLQLTAGFGFAAARSLIPYLRDLGVSHLYLSPSLQAREGSTHGYDVIDPDRLSDDLGGDSAFRALVADAHAAGLGVVLDIVPNHMATDEHNRFWTDPELRRKFFDVDET